MCLYEKHIRIRGVCTRNTLESEVIYMLNNEIRKEMKMKDWTYYI